MKNLFIFLFLAWLLSGCQKTDRVFHENFESYTRGKSLGNQGPWKSDDGFKIPVNLSFELNGNALDGFNSIAQDRAIAQIYRPIQFKRERVYIIRIDAYPKLEQGVSHNSGIKLSNSKNETLVAWTFVNDAPKEPAAWKFSSPGIPDFKIPSAGDLPAKLNIVIDPFNKVVYGQRTVYGKTEQTDYRELTSQQFDSISKLMLFVDYRYFPQKSGLQFDNLSVITSPKDSIHKALRKAK